MHGKAIAGSAQHTACAAVKTMTDLFPASMFTAGVLTVNARYAWVQAETQNLRYTTDGQTPVAGALGFVLVVGQFAMFTPAELASLKIIADTAGGVANAQLYYA